MGVNELDRALKPFCEKIRSIGDNGNEIFIITHLDADGIISASIICSALTRLGAKCTIRTVSDLTLDLIEQIQSENHDFYIVTDLGGGMANELFKALNNKWMIIDHHQIPSEEMLGDYNDQILNAWKYSIDGGKEICAGGMAYLVANTLDRKNRDLPLSLLFRR